MAFRPKMRVLTWVFLLFMPAIVQAAQNFDLDEEINLIISSQRSPFVKERAAKRHPRYSALVAMAAELGVKLKWVPTVSGAVRMLPYHEDRYRFSASDEFDGWFDEFTSPNLIFIHKEATLVIVVHELRHALQLGSHGLSVGNKHDRIIQAAKREVAKFQSEIAQYSISTRRKNRLKRQSTRLLESLSEIMAHGGDRQLAREFESSQVGIQQDFIRQYSNEFRANLKALLLAPESANEPFVKTLEQAYNEYLLNMEFL